MNITELLMQLPARNRFVPGPMEEKAFNNALERGWTVTQVADAIINGTGQNAHSPSGLSVKILRSAAGSPPPPPERGNQAGAPPAPGKPECSVCGQPYGRRSVSPSLGEYNRDCVDCGERLVLVDPPRVLGGSR
jgi:hypothetical protein